MAVYAEANEVESQLDRMGLTLEGLQRVVSTAVGGFASTTSFHPTAAGGTFLYHEATAALRRLVMSSGSDWDYDEVDQQPRTFSSTRGLTIVVQSGDENTGLEEPEREPRPRHSKGAATGRKVATNSMQLTLFSLPHVTPKNDERPSGMLTWILLIAVVDGVARAELSLPNDVDDQGRPYAWEHRIVIPEQQVGSPVEQSGTHEAAPDVEVDVTWKQ